MLSNCTSTVELLISALHTDPTGKYSELCSVHPKHLKGIVDVSRSTPTRVAGQAMVTFCADSKLSGFFWGGGGGGGKQHVKRKHI